MVRTEADRFWPKVDKNGPLHPVLGTRCWMWTAGTDPDGYGRFTVFRDGRKVYRGAHRIAWEMAHGPIADGLVVMHRCDNPGCVNAEHLTTGTQEDNARDRDTKGRHGPSPGDHNGMRVHPESVPRGERNGFAKLTDVAVAAIRRGLASGESKASLGRAHGVSDGTIRFIERGLTWRHVPQDGATP